jgi:hypothetical protein
LKAYLEAKEVLILSTTDVDITGTEGYAKYDIGDSGEVLVIRFMIEGINLLKTCSVILQALEVLHF